MGLNFTDEKIKEIELCVNENEKAISQLLNNNCESEIVLEIEEKRSCKISYRYIYRKK